MMSPKPPHRQPGSRPPFGKPPFGKPAFGHRPYAKAPPKVHPKAKERPRGEPLTVPALARPDAPAGEPRPTFQAGRPIPKPPVVRPGALPGVRPAPKPSNKSTDWNPVADWYDDLVGDAGSEFHREVVLPGTLRLLAAKRGDHVLDLACGQGVLCRLLSANGVESTGVDAAPGLIDAAKARQGTVRPPSAAAHFVVGDARDLKAFPDERFTAAACVLAVQNIHPLAPVFAAVARVLKPMGRVVVVLMHPCFRGPKETAWGWDGQANIQYRRVDRYLVPRKEPIVTHPGSDPDAYTWSFHKPLNAYVKAMRQAGLLVDAMEEWPSHKHSDSGPRAAAENVAREEIPMFMAIRGVKVPGLTGGPDPTARPPTPADPAPDPAPDAADADPAP